MTKLFEAFPPVSTKDWMSVVERDLKGADFEKKLVWNSPEGLKVPPFYRREDLAGLEHQTQQVPGQFPYLRGKKTTDNRWSICQPITRRDPLEANAVALKALDRGAEAVCFSSKVCEGRLYGQRVLTTSDFDALLSNIDVYKSQLHFDWGGASVQALAQLRRWCQTYGVQEYSIQGSIEIDPLGQISLVGHLPKDLNGMWDRLSSYLKEGRQSFQKMKLLVLHTGTFHERGSNLSQDLALVMAQAVDTLAALTDRGWEAEEVFEIMGVKASVSTSYFMEIAFFRALRQLWAQLSSAYKVSKEHGQLWVHGETADINKTIYDPHVNILRQTTETMSAVIGGVDVMSVKPWNDTLGQANEGSERLARNTQLVIREETGFDHSVDPSAGSYYIEKLTAGLCDRAWELFREIEATGGYVASLKGGMISEWIQKSRESREKNVASRRTTLLGTNQYPNSSEKKMTERNLDTGHELSDKNLATCPGSLESMATIPEVL